MKHRNIPFGYCYENGTISINTKEAEILSQIFADYQSGMSLLKIAEKLNADKIEYAPGITGWNKARIMHMIENERYLGNDIYPAIITADMQTDLKRLKCKRNKQKNTDRTADIFQLSVPVLCPNCGSKMRRRHDARYKVSERWACQNSKCKKLIEITDNELLEGITAVLNSIIRQPDQIAEAEVKNEPSSNLRKLNAEIVQTLETYHFSKDGLRKKMMECISLKYAEIDSNKYISKILKADFEESSPLSSFPSELCKAAVKSVYLGTDKTISLTLINNQKIGKE